MSGISLQTGALHAATLSVFVSNLIYLCRAGQFTLSGFFVLAIPALVSSSVDRNQPYELRESFPYFILYGHMIARQARRRVYKRRASPALVYGWWVSNAEDETSNTIPGTGSLNATGQ